MLHARSKYDNASVKCIAMLTMYSLALTAVAEVIKREIYRWYTEAAKNNSSDFFNSNIHCSGIYEYTPVSSKMVESQGRYQSLTFIVKEDEYGASKTGDKFNQINVWTITCYIF